MQEVVEETPQPDLEVKEVGEDEHVLQDDGEFEKGVLTHRE